MEEHRSQHLPHLLPLLLILSLLLLPLQFILPLLTLNLILRCRCLTHPHLQLRFLNRFNIPGHLILAIH